MKTRVFAPFLGFGLMLACAESTPIDVDSTPDDGAADTFEEATDIADTFPDDIGTGDIETADTDIADTNIADIDSADLTPVDTGLADTDIANTDVAAQVHTFAGASDFRPTLAFARPTAQGLDLRFSSGIATCEDFFSVVVLQDFALQVIIDPEDEPILAGLRLEDSEAFTPPSRGTTRVTWLVTALDTSLTAFRYDILITAASPTRLAGHLDADFEARSYEPFADLATGHLEGDFDVEICQPGPDVR